MLGVKRNAYSIGGHRKSKKPLNSLCMQLLNNFTGEVKWMKFKYEDEDDDWDDEDDNEEGGDDFDDEE